jgi:hypothetical protein
MSKNSVPSTCCAMRSALAAIITLFAPLEVYAVQNQHGSPAEVLPPPAAVVGSPNDPLARLIGEDVNRDGVHSLSLLTTDIRVKDLRDGKPAGDVPPDEAHKVLNLQPQYANGCERRPWMPLCYHWEASGLFSQPLYFEDWNLERYGYSPKGLRLLQPVLSAGRFYLTVATLPYQIVVHPPKEKVYALGYYRPGSPAPYRWSRPEIRPLAALAALGFYTGLVFLIP